MATLPEEVLAKGRDLIKSKDIEGLKAWLIEHKVPINHDMVINSMSRILAIDDVNKALKLFKVIEEIDIDVERLKKIIINTCLLLIILGILGGIAFMVKSAFWGL